jgi:hypothetical protein
MVLIYGVVFNECAHLFIDLTPFLRFHLQEITLKTCLTISNIQD